MVAAARSSLASTGCDANPYGPVQRLESGADLVDPIGIGPDQDRAGTAGDLVDVAVVELGPDRKSTSAVSVMSSKLLTIEVTRTGISGPSTGAQPSPASQSAVSAAWTVRSRSPLPT